MMEDGPAFAALRRGRGWRIAGDGPTQWLAEGVGIEPKLGLHPSLISIKHFARKLKWL